MGPVALLPYNPQLSPAERLFEDVRRRVERAVYAPLDDEAAAVEAFLQELSTDPARVRRLCGRDRITAAHDALHRARQERRDHTGLVLGGFKVREYL